MPNDGTSSRFPERGEVVPLFKRTRPVTDEEIKASAAVERCRERSVWFLNLDPDMPLIDQRWIGPLASKDAADAAFTESKQLVGEIVRIGEFIVDRIVIRPRWEHDRRGITHPEWIRILEDQQRSMNPNTV